MESFGGPGKELEVDLAGPVVERKFHAGMNLGLPSLSFSLLALTPGLHEAEPPDHPLKVALS